MEACLESDSSELRKIASRLMELVDAGGTPAVVSLKDDPHYLLKRKPSEASVAETDSVKIAEMASREYAARRERQNVFADADELFAEPAWDILLDLVIQKVRCRRVTVSSVCIASDVPPTTALRWIKLLVERGLLSRSQGEADKRVAYLELTDEGWLKMARYFSSSKPAKLHDGRRFGPVGLTHA